MAITRSGRAKASTPQPSVMVGIVAGIDPGVVCHHGQRRLLRRMLGHAVAGRLPAAVDAVGEEGEVVARAVVAQPLLGGPSEFRKRRGIEPAGGRPGSTRLDVDVLAGVRGADHREHAVVQPERVQAARGDQRLGLERLGGRAQRRDAVGIAAAGDQRAVGAHDHGVDAVVALGEAVSVARDDAGIGHAERDPITRAGPCAFRSVAFRHARAARAGGVRHRPARRR